MRIAMVSEHASPLAVLGGVDAGGQNVHVAALASALARLGDTVVVHTRRDDPRLARRVPLAPRRRGRPRRRRPADARSPRTSCCRTWPRSPPTCASSGWTSAPDVVHAHFWMSALAALDAADGLGIPVVHTFHALGTVKRRHQGDARHQPAPSGSRSRRDDRALGRPDRRHLHATRSSSCCGWAPTGAGSRSSRAASISTASAPTGPVEPRGARRRLLAACRLVERKGLADAVTALAERARRRARTSRAARRRARWTPTPRRSGCARSPTRLGVGDRLVLRGRVGRDEMPPLLRSADAVVCVPWYEPFGIVPLEAMACGVPGRGDRRRRADRLGRARRDRACTSRRATRARSRGALRSLLDRPGAAARRSARRRAARARQRYGFDRIARSTPQVYARAG